jgi:hypothetical protein
VSGIFSGIKMPSLSSVATDIKSATTVPGNPATVKTKSTAKVSSTKATTPEEQVLLDSYPTQARIILTKHIQPTVKQAGSFSIYTWRYNTANGTVSVRIVLDSNNQLVDSSLN